MRDDLIGLRVWWVASVAGDRVVMSGLVRAIDCGTWDGPLRFNALVEDADGWLHSKDTERLCTKEIKP